MNVLGIESSCDDTSVALIKHTDNGFKVLAEKTASQVDIHKKYGGVVPEVAARAHAEAIMPVIEAVLDKQNPPDCIAVTSGPGLITSLLVGVEAAKTLSYLWDIPLVSVNHITGHIHSVEISQPPIQFPALALVVSGGHTELIFMKSQGDYVRIGATKDDAAGECFDKVAKLIGFDYPGGPKISRTAQGGRIEAIHFPRPMLQNDNYDFSFAGLKTACLYWLRDHGVTSTTPWKDIDGVTLQDFCASFEQAIVDVLMEKTLRAAREYRPTSILLAGGVAANKKIRETLQNNIQHKLPGSLFRMPELRYCMDNGAMIAASGWYKAQKKDFTPWPDVIANPNWELS